MAKGSGGPDQGKKDTWTRYFARMRPQSLGSFFPYCSTPGGWVGKNKKKSVCPLRGAAWPESKMRQLLPLVVVGGTSKTSTASLSPFSITLHDFYSRSILHKFESDCARCWLAACSLSRHLFCLHAPCAGKIIKVTLISWVEFLARARPPANYIFCLCVMLLSYFSHG